MRQLGARVDTGVAPRLRMGLNQDPEYRSGQPNGRAGAVLPYSANMWGLLNRDLHRVRGDARGRELDRHCSRADKCRREQHVHLIDAGVACVAGI